MAHRHLSSKLLDRMLQGDASPDEVRELALHLIEACPECGEVADLEWPGLEEEVDAEAMRPVAADSSGPAGEPGGLDDAMFDRVRRNLRSGVERVRRQQSQAPALVAELMRHPVERQRMLVRNHSKFHSLPVAELLLEQVWRIGFDDPEAAHAQAEVVLDVAEALPEESPAVAVAQDLRARAWAYRGNLRRMMSDFKGAEAEFARASQLLEQGTGDPLEKARWLDLMTTLRIGQRRFQEAREFIQGAIGIYRSADEQHLTGRAMISLASVLQEQGELARAVEVLEAAVRLVDGTQEPRLLLVAEHNLASMLVDRGDHERAAFLLPEVRQTAVRAGSRFDLLRFRWLEGTVLLGLGREPRAEAALLEVRKGFLELGVAYDAAAVSLELAGIYLRQGRTSELKDLAAEVIPVFRSRDVHQEAFAALLLFQRAVEMETLTLRMVEEVSEVLRRFRGQPRPEAPPS